MSKPFDVKDFTPEQLSRFWAKVSKSGDCWEWLAAKSDNLMRAPHEHAEA